MREENIMTIPALYRDDFRITGYYFGEGEKSACIMGSLRGNEYQQLYVAQQLIVKLRELEQQGKICSGKQILVIPCGNPYSINTKKRFWTIDNTDINRMFPGYNEGETTQRIADGIFSKINDYKYGIQLASFYMSGRFMPHIRMMKTGYEDTEMAKEFGLPYVVLHHPRPFDTTTLNYNWQIWGAKTFSLYTTTTARIDKEGTAQGVNAILRFLAAEGLIDADVPDGEESTVVETSEIINVRSDAGGFFEPSVKPGDSVNKGDVLGIITHPYLGDVTETICAPEAGSILFIHDDPMIYAATNLIKMAPKMQCSKI